ncbi:hypothetical protein EJB05_44204, partial [Eragrostis curvula]
MRLANGQFFEQIGKDAFRTRHRLRTSMSGNHIYTDDSSDVDELVASMVSDLIYWRSLGNMNGSGRKCRLIYKVLQCNRASDPNAYEPRVLSIGPYHHGAPSLLPMEKEKWLCLDYVLKLNFNRSLHDYLAVVTTLEREARICYSEDSIPNSRTFVEMLLLDSCFILVCLNGIAGIKMQAGGHEEFSQDENVLTEIVVGRNEQRKEGKETIPESRYNLSCRSNEDFVVQMEENQVDTNQQSYQGSQMEPYNGQTIENTDQGEQWYNSSAVYDLLLLENQVPFFIVTKIFELLIDDGSTTNRLLTNNIAKFIEGVLLHLPLAIQDSNRPKDFDHLLHLCYMYFKPSCSTQHNHQMGKKAGPFRNLLCWGFSYLGCNTGLEENEETPLTNEQFEVADSVKQLKRWRRAEEYHEAGVEFTDRVFDDHNPHSLLDIELRNGTLHIPCLAIDDKSGTLFRNLLAFEQSCPALGNDIASYVYFMSQLISVPDDVALLARKGVIVHQLDSDEEVSSLFAKLFEYVVFDFSGDNYLKSLCHTMDAHYQNRLNRWMAWLWHNHFGNPWLGFTALASVVMIFCSIGQTILAFLSYMNIELPIKLNGDYIKLQLEILVSAISLYIDD